MLKTPWLLAGIPLLLGCSLQPLPIPGDAETNRASCTYGAGTLAADTHDPAAPSGATIPVDHILVLMQENRSFDHYFQKLPEYGQPDVDVAPADFSNPDENGNPVTIFHDTAYCFLDTAHSWAASHHQYNYGKMDGFVLASEGKLDDDEELPPGLPQEMLGGERAMSYYDATDLPYYYELANQFSIADRYFSSLLGPTWPNRMHLYAASSYGITRNVPAKEDRKTIFDLLAKAGVSYTIYADEMPGIVVFSPDLAAHSAHVKPLADLVTDIETGKLASVVFVDPILGNHDQSSIDEHPPAMAPIGEAHIARILDALMKSSLWASSAAFLVYDEHGGLWDHVPPPPACIPDGHAPKLVNDDPDEPFDRYGFRVPMIAISPFAKAHHVSHRVYDHTSITRFIEARFGLPAMTRRDANAEVPWDMFDFTSVPHMMPPSIPIPTPDPTKVEICEAIFAD
ncbi:Phospholipase C 4 precursor [Minicystis rosea]|nr:Phospholipase C 4 precursor [Minicystis rosea]